jgi:hypothetical protein
MVGVLGLFDFLATQKAEVRVAEVASHVIAATAKVNYLLAARTDLVVFAAREIFDGFQKSILVDRRHFSSLIFHLGDQLWWKDRLEV